MYWNHESLVFADFKTNMKEIENKNFIRVTETWMENITTMTTESSEVKKDMTRIVKAKDENMHGQKYTTEHVKICFEPIKG